VHTSAGKLTSVTLMTGAEEVLLDFFIIVSRIVTCEHYSVPSDLMQHVESCFEQTN
jgi:hypothetical protein